MGRFVVGRALQAALTLLVVLTLLWVAVTVLPGDPVRALFGFRQPTPEAYARVREQLRLDEPVLVQYLLHLRDVLTLDLGRSFLRDPFGRPAPGVPVWTLVRAALPASGVLLLGALAVQAVVGVLAGAVSAARSGTWLSRCLDAVALLAVATPVLVAAYVLRTVVGVELRWLPVAGTAAGWTAYVLPVLSLAALSTGYLALLLKSDLLGALAAPWAAAARAGGIGPVRVTAVHAMRDSLVPVVTFVAATSAARHSADRRRGRVAGAGRGRTARRGDAARDRSLVIGIVTFVAVLVVLANAVADVVVAALDPRLRVPT